MKNFLAIYRLQNLNLHVVITIGEAGVVEQRDDGSLFSLGDCDAVKLVIPTSPIAVVHAYIIIPTVCWATLEIPFIDVI